MTAPDALAITMVAVLAFALGSLATMFLVMSRNAKRNSERLDLPEEEQPAETASAKSESEPSLEGWEKDANWWKE